MASSSLGELVQILIWLIMMLVFLGAIGLFEIWALQKIVRWIKARNTNSLEDADMKMKFRAEQLLDAERMRQAQAARDADLVRQALRDLQQINSEAQKRNTSVTVRRVDY